MELNEIYFHFLKEILAIFEIKCVFLHPKFLQIYNIFPKQKENDKRN